jgi:hypothetical protein
MIPTWRWNPSSGGTFVYEELFGEYNTKTFKTLRNATNYGSKRLQQTGYQATHDLHPDASHMSVVAVWKDQGKVIARVSR